MGNDEERPSSWMFHYIKNRISVFKGSLSSVAFCQAVAFFFRLSESSHIILTRF